MEAYAKKNTVTFYFIYLYILLEWMESLEHYINKYDFYFNSFKKVNLLHATDTYEI